MQLPCSLLRPWGWLAVLVGLLPARPAAAQAEYSQWYFGDHAGISFPGGTAAPVLLPTSQMASGEGCAAIADERGQLLFYTNGIQAWNRLHQPLANGTALGGYAGPSDVPPNSATQGAAVVAKPGSTTEYYVFTVDAAEHNLQTGLTYSLVDMSRQGGLGEVVAKAVPLPSAAADGRLAEKLAVVRHANQRDVWVVVHGWNSNIFYSWLVTPAGLAPAPVASAGGLVQRGSGDYPASKNLNAIGQLKVSPDGRRLALVQFRSAPVELFDFNCGTGVVANPRKLDKLYTYSNYGVEFSPNSNFLYVSSAQGLTQYDVPSGQPQIVGSPATYGALQLGPDGRIYHVNGDNSTQLYVVDRPDRSGLACAYQPASNTRLATGSYTYSYLGLPTVLVTPPPEATPLVSFGVIGTEACVGETTTFTATSYPALPGATVSWAFGDPAAGPANTAVGISVQHLYRSAGTYQAAMRVTTNRGQVYTYAQPVTILARAPTQLRASSRPCSGQPVTLAVYPAPPPGTSYAWQDGSSAATFAATTSGTYWVEVAPPQLCAYRDSITLQIAPSPVVDLGPDRLIGCDEAVTLDAGSAVAGSTYQWQDGSTRAQYRAVQAGTYSVKVSTPAGCTATDTVRLQPSGACSVFIPTIITPNGDRRNDSFVVRGIPAGTFALTVYNRWGRLVYAHAQYANDWQAADAADGLYYYLVTTDTQQRYKGCVEVRHAGN